MAKFRPAYRYRLHPYRRLGSYYYGRRWPWLQGATWSQDPVSSSFVAWAQRCLAIVFGPVVPQDGVFGPETRGFVEQFQAQHGLRATGDLDEATVSALQAAVSSGPAVSSPSEPAPPPPIFVAPPPSPGAPAPPPQRHHSRGAVPWFSPPSPPDGRPRLHPY